MSEPKPSALSRSQQKRIAAQTKEPEPFAAVKRIIEDMPVNAYPHLGGLQAAARDEIKQAEERELELQRDKDDVYEDYQDAVKRLNEAQEREVKWRERVEELKAAFGHYHKAGVNGDKCAKCGLDIRDDIHYREPKS